METDKLNPLIYSRAYPLFKDEVSKYVELFAEVVDKERLSEASIRKEFAMIFHKIKGSSGFFGFSQIYSLAGLIEGILNKLDFKKNPDHHEVVDLFLQFKSECEKLP